MGLLSANDAKAKKGLIYETEDYRKNGCVVTCFKKVAHSNTQLRMNCFVSQFEFPSRDDE
jgi:hypothetical protein